MANGTQKCKKGQSGIAPADGRLRMMIGNAESPDRTDYTYNIREHSASGPIERIGLSALVKFVAERLNVQCSPVKS